MPQARAGNSVTTKKLLIIVGSVLGAVALVAALFVGAILGIVFYSIGQSEAAVVAKSFLRNNEKLKRDVGEVRDFGRLVTGSIDVRNSDGTATLYLKVIGARRTTNATVSLAYRQGQKWRVMDASYKTEKGETAGLLEETQEADEMSAP